MHTNPDTHLLRRQALARLGGLGVAAGLWAIGRRSEAAPAPPKLITLNDSLASPWGMAFLPDRRIVVTEKGGTMQLLSADGASKTALSGVPVVNSSGQGGLLDVAVDPDFGAGGNNWLYISYSEGSLGSVGTAVARARLSGSQLVDLQVIFRQRPKVSGGGHFGSRLAFRSDKTLFVTLGERQKKTPAQDLNSDLGKVVRIQRDGSIPSGNPQFASPAQTEIWSWGHRNPQGAAIHPDTGELWVTEHGPQGGDELNVAKAGRNFGWPKVSYGCDYGVSPVTPDCRIGGTQGVHAPLYTEPVSWWPAPSIAPAGLMFYSGDKFPEWRGNAFLGALAGTALWRVVLKGETEVSRESVFGNMGQRVRCVKQGPDGWIYLLTDEGKLLRIER